MYIRKSTDNLFVPGTPHGNYHKGDIFFGRTSILKDKRPESLTTKGLKILDSGLTNRYNMTLGKELGSINWTTINVIREESGYV